MAGKTKGCRRRDWRVPAALVRTQLNEADVLGLKAFRSLLYFKRYTRAFVERAVTTGGNGGEMNEYIFAILALDKAKSFSCVKPFYCSGFFQNDSFCFCDLTLTYRLREAQAPESKIRKPVQRNSTDVQGR